MRAARAFLGGLACPLRAFPFIVRNRLWGPCVWPIVIDGLLLAALLAVTVLYADDLRNLLWRKPEGSAVLTRILIVLWWGLHAALVVVMLFLDAVLFVVLGFAIAGPFLDVLSERTEAILGASPPPAGLGYFVRSVGYSIADLLKTLALYVAIIMPLLLINLIPLAGSALYGVLSACFTWLILSLQFVGLPLNRRFAPFRSKVRLVWGNRASCLGFGCASFVILFVPVLNLLLLPLAAVGGTLLYRELVASGRVLEPPAPERHPT